MLKKKKRMLSVVLALVMLLTYSPVVLGSINVDVLGGDSSIQEGKVVRFHFDGIHTDVPITLGQQINPTLIPTPATRYGRIGVPGQVFMGWFTTIFPNMHYIHNPYRATAFNLSTLITADILDSEGVFNLHGSWLQYGDVNGDGMVNMTDLITLQRFLLREITGAQIVIETADVNVDGAVNMGDLTSLQRHLIRDHGIILGVPEPIGPIEDEIVEINATVGDSYIFVLSVYEIKDFNNKVFRITYNSSMLRLVDIAAQTRQFDAPPNHVNIGPVSGTDMVILSVSNGEVIFRMNIIQDDMTWTGALTMIQFNALASGQTTVVVSVE